VDQDHRRPAAGDPVDRAVPVQLDLVCLEAAGHGQTLPPSAATITAIAILIVAAIAWREFG
jgi:hypothetical protein